MTAISSSPKSGPSQLDADAQRAFDRRRGRFVPWIIAAFYLAFMSVLISFVVIAYRHPPSESTTGAYEKGLAYNDTLARSEQQAALGWRSALTYEGGQLTAALQDAGAAPIAQARVKAWFVHPADSSLDRSVDLIETGKGTYAARVSLPAGLWSVHVSANADGRQYQTTTQIEAP